MKKPKVILVNLDDNDFIRAYFFQRHLLRVLLAQQIDVALFSAIDLRRVFANISGPPISRMLYEDFIRRDIEDLNEIPAVFGKKDILLKRLVKGIQNEPVRAIIFNSFEPFVYDFFKNNARSLPGIRLIIYDPHALDRMRTSSQVEANGGLFRNATLFIDTHLVEPYYRYGFVARNIKKVNLVLDEDYFRILSKLGPREADQFALFSGGDSARDYGALEKIARELEIPYIFISSVYKKPRIDGLGTMSPYLLYGRYHLRMANSKIVVICLKKNGNWNSGITNIVAAHALGKPVIIDRTEMTERYVQHGKNGFLFDDKEEIKKHVSNLLKNRKMYRRMCANAAISFSKKNLLSDLANQIVKQAL